MNDDKMAQGVERIANLVGDDSCGLIESETPAQATRRECDMVDSSIFDSLVATANRVAAKFNGSRSTCILTSFALHDVLRRLGYNSRPLRIEAAVFPDDRKFCGTILGSLNGCRHAAGPGMWWGHLAVVVDDDWLLDPTLDQANKKEWPRSVRVGPLAVRLSDEFWAERGLIFVRANKCRVRFSPHPRQVGFANAGDARPSHWKPLADQIFRTAARRSSRSTEKETN